MSTGARAQPATHWVTSWTAADQPLSPGRAAPFDGAASDRNFRLIIKPDLWGYSARLRFSNVYGTAPVTFDGVTVGLQLSGGVLVPRSARPVAFHAQRSVTVPPGETVWSDPVGLGFVGNTQSPLLMGRSLAVSFHVTAAAGPVTWHLESLATSFASTDGAAAPAAAAEDDRGFPIAIRSWCYLDALDMRAPADSFAIVALGDSITDGVGATPDAADRWPDVLSRRLHAAFGERVSVVNQGIGGDHILGPDGAPSLRLERDVLGLSGVGAVIWLEGINDLAAGATPEALAEAMKRVVGRLRAGAKGVRVAGATLTPLHRAPGEPIDRQRRALNQFLHLTDLFDGVVDFDAALADPHTGTLLPLFDSGDGLHPSRAGYAAMGAAVDLKLVAPPPKPAPAPPIAPDEKGNPG